MKKIAIIGYGSMGRMLCNSFLQNDVIKYKEMRVFIREGDTATKALIKDAYQNKVKTTETDEGLKDADLIFLCVKPKDLPGILMRIGPKLKSDAHLVSIAVCVSLKQLEREFSGSVSRIVPSLTMLVNEGVTLLAHNSSVSNEQKDYLNYLFEKSAPLKEIKEENFEVATDLTSCAPGLISAIFDSFLKAAMRHSSLDQGEVNEMVLETLEGTTKLIHEKGLRFDETIERVATKGGITEEGVKVLSEQLPDVFDHMFECTLAKNDSVQERVSAAFVEKDWFS